MHVTNRSSRSRRTDSSGTNTPGTGFAVSVLGLTVGLWSKILLDLTTPVEDNIGIIVVHPATGIRVHMTCVIM